MADVYSRVETVNNAGTTVATFGGNALKHVINQADVGREQIIKIAKTDITNTELNTIIQEITIAGGAGGTSDAFTVAAVGTATGAEFVSGTTDVVYLRVQGTGTYTPEGSNAHGVSGAVTTIEATFTQASYVR
jgi:hypothetical protein